MKDVLNLIKAENSKVIQATQKTTLKGEDISAKKSAVNQNQTMNSTVPKAKVADTSVKELQKEEDQRLSSENTELKKKVADMEAYTQDMLQIYKEKIKLNAERVKKFDKLKEENSSLKEANEILQKSIHELTTENKKLSSALSNAEIKSEASARLYTGLIGKNRALSERINELEPLSGDKPNIITTFIDGTQNFALTCVNGAKNLTPYAVGVTGLLLATDFALSCVAPQYAFLSSTAVLGYKLVDVASGVVARYGVYQVGKYIGEREVKGQSNIFLGLPAIVICPIFSSITFNHEKAIEGLLLDAALIAAGYCKGIFEKDKYADFFCVMKKGLACGASSVLGAFSSSFGYDVWSNAERTSIIGLVCTGIASTACYMESSYSSRNQQVSIQR